MSHCSDDELVLLYYGEDDRSARHVAACTDCSERFQGLSAVLQSVALPEEPARDDHYGLEVWQRIRHRLPPPAPWWHGLFGAQWTMAAAVAVVLIAFGFTAGRLWPPVPAPAAPAVADADAGADQGQRRVLLLTVADHLEQTDRVLTDLVNAPDGMDISGEQAWARDLVAASRLYRQEATLANERSLAAMLDELERTLLEVVHRPSTVTDEDVDEIRRRIDSAALLFKVRVMSTELRELTTQAPGPSDSPEEPGASPRTSASCEDERAVDWQCRSWRAARV
jgi:hypothetical protein